MPSEPRWVPTTTPAAPAAFSAAVSAASTLSAARIATFRPFAVCGCPIDWLKPLVCCRPPEALIGEVAPLSTAVSAVASAVPSGMAVAWLACTGSPNARATCAASTSLIRCRCPSIRSRTSRVSTLLSSNCRALVMCSRSTANTLFQNSRACP